MNSDAAAPPPGPAVDSRGVPVVDPSRNVLDLVNAAIKRQDDMREAWQEASNRELYLRREQRESEARDLRTIIETRLDGMDLATKLRIELIDSIPQMVHDQIAHLRDVQEEKFSSIANQFAERDVRTEQATQSSGQALAAALQAAKELVGAQGEASAAAAVKSETSFTKQIDQIGALIQTGNAASDARITELKERIDRGEGNTVGIRDAKIEYREESNESRSASSLIVAVIGTFLVALSLGVGIAALMLGK